MKKILLVPDSFKGTMTSGEICDIMQAAILAHHPQAQVLSMPVADGGEGSVDCFLASVGGEKASVRVKGPYFKDMGSFYGLLPDGTAVVEMAACAGLPLVGENRAAEKTTTYGVGQLIAHAVEGGCKRLVIALGGSATNDGGAGCAAALGVRFLDASGEAFVPTGETLGRIAKIDASGLLPRLRDLSVTAMCDIDNPLCGPTGAAHVFGPQKGADEAMVRLLDEGLAHMAKIVQRDLNKDILTLPGSGAAGGMGGGMVAFLGAQLQMGIEAVLDTVRFDDLVHGADMVFTGEGKLDSQSLRGKVVIGVARRAKKAGVPVTAIVGDIGDDTGAAYGEGVTGVFSINRVAVPYIQAKPRAKDDLALTMDNLLRYLKALKR